MFQPRPELRVVVRKLGTKFFAITTQNTGLEICTSEFQHDPSGLARTNPLWLLQRGMRLPEKIQPFGGADGEAQVTRYGQRLFGYLFGDGQRLRRFLDANPNYEGARLTLTLHPDTTSLWRLPWAYLHDGERFLCLDGNLLLSRRPAELPDLSPALTPPPLRVLFIIATPEDQPALDVERELAVVQDALHDTIRVGNLSMEVLEEATLPTLQDALTREKYDVLHYIGHGAFSKNRRQSFLCFENRVGETEAVGALQLQSLLENAPTLRMMVISACQSVQIGVFNAFDNVATGLLRGGLPAALTVPASLPDESAIELARTFYGRLVQGDLPVECLHDARLALKQIDDGRSPERKRFDWGVPALYLRAQAMSLVDHDLTLEVPTLIRRKDRTTAELSLPAVFVDRVKELHALRAALREHIPALYLWGDAGTGKSTLTAKLIEYAGISLDNVLVVHCRELVEPALALERIARFWRAHQTEAHLEAADLLMDARRDPEERARAAQHLLAEHQYLIVFDDIDAWFEVSAYPDSTGPARIANPALRGALRGFLSTHSATSYLFTAKRRWTEVETLPAEAKLEIQLGELSERQAILMMQSLRYLERQSPAIKQDIYRLIGGQPEVLKLLDGWMASGNTQKKLLINPPVESRATSAWQQYLLNGILDNSDSSENQALMAIAVLKGPFSAGLVAKVSHIAVKYAVPLVKRWEKCSLLQFHHLDEAKDPWYTLHPVVSDHIVARMERDDLIEFHARAAAHYGAPFLDEARRRVVARNLSTWSEERIAWLARDATGILGMWVRQTQNAEHARQSVKRALSWQYHLFEAEKFAEAAQIVRAIVPVLKRWGRYDLAEALLQRNAATAGEPDRASSLDELARLYVEHGHLNEALRVYESVYRMLEAQEARPQMAHILCRVAGIYAQLGDYDQAIKLNETTLRRMRELGDEAGESRCLHQLTSIYRQIEQHKTAMVYGQAAKELDEKRGDTLGAAAVVYEQGLILKQMKRIDAALICFRKSLQVACEVGNEALATNSLREINATCRDATQIDSAIETLLKVLTLCQRINAREAIKVLESLHDLYTRHGDVEKAIISAEQAQRLARQQDAGEGP